MKCTDLLNNYFDSHELTAARKEEIRKNLPLILQSSVDFIYAQWQCCDVESALTMFFPVDYKPGRTDEKIGMMLEIQKTAACIWETGGDGPESGPDMGPSLNDFELQVMGRMIDFSY